MFIYIPNDIKIDAEAIKLKTKLYALKYIRLYPLGAKELLLDSYLKENYSIGLKQMCKVLVMSMTFMKTSNSNAIIGVFKEAKFDKVARLITYGNGKLAGSNILKNALTVLK